MPVAHPKPTNATVKELYANASRCAKPGCLEPLYVVEPDSGARSLHTRVSHICARSEGGPRWDATMSPKENRAVANLLVLCLQHAAEIDSAARVDDYPIELLREWKDAQLAASDGSGVQLTDTEVAEVARASFDIQIADSELSLGGAGGAAPGAGGGGGGALGSNAMGGDGGAGGEIKTAVFRAEDLPAEVPITIGKGGRAGVDGGDGEDGGDTAFGDVLRAAGGKGGKGRGEAPSEALSGRAPATGGRPLLLVSSAMLANQAELRNGLANVLGGGWSAYVVAEFPHQLSGHLVAIVELGDVGVRTISPIRLELLNPDGAIAFASDACIDAAPGELRLVTTWSFFATVHAPGRWTVRLVVGDRELARIAFDVKQSQIA